MPRFPLLHWAHHITFLSPSPLPPPALHPQDDDISGVVRYRTYEVLKAEANNPRLRWAYLPYSMHMAGPREAIQHMIIRKNYGELVLVASPAALLLLLSARSRSICVAACLGCLVISTKRSSLLVASLHLQLACMGS
jgi:hypothetical protein